MRISMIAARSENGFIGNNNDIPWRVKGDWDFFKRTTMGHVLISGRKTLESFPDGKPLSNRFNIIVTRNPNYICEGALVVTSLEDALAEALEISKKENLDEVFIGGGAEIYRQAFPFSNRLYLTEIHTSVEGDTKFPDFKQNEWLKKSSQFFKKAASDTADYTINIWDRTK